MSVQFQDFSIQVKDALDDKALQFLEEAASEIESAARRNSRVASGQLKGSWNHQVNDAAKEAKVGSPLENAIWEEFGTGEYAAAGDGRKGGWSYQDDAGDWHHTRGKGRTGRFRGLLIAPKLRSSAERRKSLGVGWMTTRPLEIVSSAMKSLGIAYGFGSYAGNAAGKIVYPYFVGEYTESPPVNEDGQQTATIMLTGFHRGTWEELETAKAKIESYFNKVSGKTVMADDGSAVAIFYDSALIIPKEDAALKSVQINLSVQEWSVNI